MSEGASESESVCECKEGRGTPGLCPEAGRRNNLKKEREGIDTYLFDECHDFVDVVCCVADIVSSVQNPVVRGRHSRGGG